MPDGERLPGAPRRVVALHLAGERLGQAAAPLGVELREAPAIALERRDRTSSIASSRTAFAVAGSVSIASA